MLLMKNFWLSWGLRRWRCLRWLLLLPLLTFGLELRAGSPVDFFRGLLSMSVEQRLDVLSDRRPNERTAILAKVREYERLSADVREKRLWQTEFHYFFHGLRSLDRSEREIALQAIEDPMKSRLWIGFQLWDGLDLESRDALIQERRAVTYLLTRVHELSALEEEPEANDVRIGSVTNVDAGAVSLSRAIQDLEATHRKLLEDFDVLAEQVGPMSAEEEAQLRVLVEAFVSLPQQKRDETFRTVLELAESSEGERQAFVQEALRWREISPEERAKWRYIATQLPPMPWDLAIEIGNGATRYTIPPTPPGFPDVPVRRSANVEGNRQK